MTIFNRISFLDKLLFTKHLAVMIKSGIPLPDGINILTDQMPNPNFKKVLLDLNQEISNGQTLRKSFAKHPEVFDALYLNLINIGEESGKLEENLEYLARELQKTYEFNKKVQGAMMYPALIISVAIVMGGGISIFVLPQLANLFSSLDVKLPITTRILLGFASVMQHYGAIIVPSIIGLILLLAYLANTKLFKPWWHRLLLNVPIFGPFIRNSESASFCRNFGLMLKSGLPITAALKALEEGTDNWVFRSYVHELTKTVEKGKSMEKELSSGRYPYLPQIVAKMIGVGEKTGKLDETLLYLGDFFADEVDSMARNLPTILEPILLVIIAAMVLFLALAIISPIYQLTGSIRR